MKRMIYQLAVAFSLCAIVTLTCREIYGWQGMTRAEAKQSLLKDMEKRARSAADTEHLMSEITSVSSNDVVVVTDSDEAWIVTRRYTVKMRGMVLGINTYTVEVRVKAGLYDNGDRWSLKILKVEKGEELEKAERAEAEARAEEWRRQNPEATCSRYYQGYVGRYKRTGALATSDSFIVRYVNPSRGKVTIEGTSGGNSLSLGQHMEISCYELSRYER